MAGSRQAGIWLVVIGVVLDNYAYLHDVVTAKHEGFIYVGPWSVVGIVAGLVMIATGCWLLARRAPHRSAE